MNPGFDKAKYIDLLSVAARQVDSVAANSPIPQPQRFARLYRAPIVGLDNRWKLWSSPDLVAVISIRDTTLNPVGWLEFLRGYGACQRAYCTYQRLPVRLPAGQRPPRGRICRLVIGTAFLTQDIPPRLDSCVQKGITTIYLLGHRPCGVIA